MKSNGNQSLVGLNTSVRPTAKLSVWYLRAEHPLGRFLNGRFLKMATQKYLFAETQSARNFLYIVLWQ